MKNKDVKIFISYKSTDANEARLLVDLISIDIEKVWFAENIALNTNYESFEKSLSENIENAIKKSTHAIIITNNNWNNSKYCQKEWELIKNEISPSNIVQVYLPFEKNPSIAIQKKKEIPSIEFKSANAVLDFIYDRFELDINRSYVNLPQDDFKNFKCRYGNISIWPLIEYHKNMNLGIVGREHSYGFNTHLGNGIYTSFDLDIDPFNPPLKTSSMESFRNLINLDDREAYRAIRKQAIKWLKTNNVHEQGLHLKYYEHNTNIGYGITYYKEWQSGKIAWSRYYFQWIYDKENSRLVCVYFQFSIVCSPSSFNYNSKGEFIEKSKREFLKYICIFESMVDSFEYKSDPTLKYLPTKNELNRMKRIFGISGFSIIGILAYLVINKHFDYPIIQEVLITFVLSVIAGFVSSSYISSNMMNLYKRKITEQVYDP